MVDMLHERSGSTGYCYERHKSSTNGLVQEQRVPTVDVFSLTLAKPETEESKYHIINLKPGRMGSSHEDRCGRDGTMERSARKA